MKTPSRRTPSQAVRGARPRPPRITQILVPVDFSDAGKPALSYAAFLARQTGASLCLLHVLEYPHFGPEFPVPPMDFSDLRERTNRNLGALQAGQFREIKTTSDIRQGLPFQAIVDAARDLRVDLIVMATHGRTGLQHILLGSTAERVVRHADCPVLVIPSRPAKAAGKPARRRKAP